MKIPRNVGGAKLATALRVFGYEKTRQDGSHIRLTTTQRGQHHITIPDHHPIKIGTLRSIVRAVADHHNVTVDDVFHKLDL